MTAVAHHPAHLMPFQSLWDGLMQAKGQGFVHERRSGRFSLFVYTRACVYDRGWTLFSMAARGLILDRDNQRIAATPFLKFFNIGETDRASETFSDNGEFETFEKMDGSLIIAWHDGDAWRCCTKGSFDSPQAKAAWVWLDHRGDWKQMDQDCTYLFEWVAPDNRVVIKYDAAELVLLGINNNAKGHEVSSESCDDIAGAHKWRRPVRHAYTSLADLVRDTAALPVTQEGFVIRYGGGLRLKVKGDEYLRVHRLISGCTPLALWQSMMERADLKEMRAMLPEEFWEDFDTIVLLINGRIDSVVAQVAAVALHVKDWTDREIGLQFRDWADVQQRFIFSYRKNNGDLLAHPKSRESVFRFVRPTGNVLDGYVASSAMNRVEEESL